MTFVTGLICPSCECEYNPTDNIEATTFADHGLCWCCHKDVLNGERCQLCLEPGHDWVDCPICETEDAS